ncbi:OLC1v1014244C1 [Oldenlandia corymbosa var. corymbosa]|uniref:OLC1v1014244C1 n=1 Tax=Oldenlandia corymbosa var. corymbosa TaxID=529605 RepID=A0AAV1E2E7_OLDCO|nr:OLC1v1014244C1 [Oldenlandia corymbosa var. corymbosa]
MKWCFLPNLSRKQSLDGQGFSNHNHNDVLLTLAKPIILARAKNNANFVFSPSSLHIVLSMIAAGAKGQTQARLLSFLRSNSIEELNSLGSLLVTSVLADGSLSGGPRVSSSNGVWIDGSTRFDLNYKNALSLFYKAHPNEVDFRNKPDEVIDEVNDWAVKETNGLIQAILQPGAVDNLSMLLANALYFKGAWEEKFDASKRKERKFHLLDGNTVKAAFFTSDKNRHISAYKGFKVLRLPYKNGRRCFSMYLYLPNAKNGLLDLVENISSRPGFVKHYSPSTKVEVGDFLIPKFKISFGFESSGTVFPSTGGHNIFQESYIDVTEDGSEAESFTDAAQYGTETTAEIADSKATCSTTPKTKKRLNFVADHPFLFLIAEDTSGTVLFMGSVLRVDRWRREGAPVGAVAPPPSNFF